MRISVMILCVCSAALGVFMLLTKQFQYLPLVNVFMCIVFLMLAYREYKERKDLTTVRILILAAVIIFVFTAIGVFL